MNLVRVQHLLVLTCILLAGKQLCAMGIELEQDKNDYLTQARNISEKIQSVYNIMTGDIDEEANITKSDRDDVTKKYNDQLEKFKTKLKEQQNQFNDTVITRDRDGVMESQYLDLIQIKQSKSLDHNRQNDLTYSILPIYEKILFKNSEHKTAIDTEKKLCKKLMLINYNISELPKIYNEPRPNLSYASLKFYCISTTFCAFITLASISLAKKTHYWSLIPAGIFLVGTIMEALGTTGAHKALYDTTKTCFDQFKNELDFDESLQEIQSNVKSLVENQKQKFASYVGKKFSYTSKNWNEGIKPIIGSNWLMRFLMPNFNKETMKQIKDISKTLNDLSTSVNSNLLYQ
jgi:hypothetical protein